MGLLKGGGNRMRIKLSTISLILLAVSLFSGCGGFFSKEDDKGFKFPDEVVTDEGGTAGPGGTVAQCTGDSDCTGSQVCVAGSCTSPTPGGGDEPPTCTTNEECGANKTCQEGECVDVICASNNDCSGGQLCNVETKECVVPNCTLDASICSDTQMCEDGVCQCDPTKTECSVSENACEVLFYSTLALGLDGSDSVPDDPALSAHHYDAPSRCCEYAGNPIEGVVDCSAGWEERLPGAFLSAPSLNTDLYCCAENDFGKTVPGRPDLYCDPNNRHGGVPDLAVQYYPSDRPMRLRFDIREDAEGNRTCKVELNIADFPSFQVENSALDAGLIINAGANYTAFPASIGNRALNESTTIADCTIDEGENLSISIDSLQLRFLATLYENSIKCNLIDTITTGIDPSECSDSFETLFGSATSSFQVLTGFNNPPLSLTTGPSSVAPLLPPSHQMGDMSIEGEPLHFEVETAQTRMRLVTTLSMPSRSIAEATKRDDNIGKGQLLEQLGSTLVSADIPGTVTLLNGDPIRNLEDLTVNCVEGGGPGPGPGPGSSGNNGVLGIALSAQFDELRELDVTEEGEGDDRSAEATACVRGALNNRGSCDYLNANLLSFAKNEDDPHAGVPEDRYVAPGSITIRNTGTAPITINIPDSVGVFHFPDVDGLRGLVLPQGEDTNFNVVFEPTVDGSGCEQAVERGTLYLDCESEVTISSSHDVRLILRGRANMPAPKLYLYDVNLQTYEETQIYPALEGASVLDFGEALINITLKSQLVRVANKGTRPLRVNSISAGEDNNFSDGCWTFGRTTTCQRYRGPDFLNKRYVGRDQMVAPIPPSGADDLFFFLTYEPVGIISPRCNGDPTLRCDQTNLTIDLGMSNITILERGNAREDKRAIISLFIQDENRVHVDPRTPVLSGHDDVYQLVKESFSFRQDSTGVMFM
jgi:hypothetical protein